MLGIENYTGFIVIGFMLNILPGTNTIYILTRSISDGRGAGVLSVMGIETGCVIHIICAAFSLSYILQSSVTIFLLIKYLGAGYLIYLGIKTFTEKSYTLKAKHRNLMPSKLSYIYFQGILTNLLNPKVSLFFLSLLPQFIASDNIYGPTPFILLGLTFMATGMMWYIFLSYMASIIAYRIDRKKFSRFIKVTSGTVLIGLGLKIAFQRN